MLTPTATTGLLPSKRTTLSVHGTCASITPMSMSRSASAALSGAPSVPSGKNKKNSPRTAAIPPGSRFTIPGLFINQRPGHTTFPDFSGKGVEGSAMALLRYSSSVRLSELFFINFLSLREPGKYLIMLFLLGFERVFSKFVEFDKR